MTDFLLAAASSLIIGTVSPEHASIPLGAQRVNMQTVTLSASCAADVTVSAITMTHGNLGEATDIERVYAMEGSRRISRTASFGGNKSQATLRLPSFRIAKCEQRTIRIMADFSPDAAAQGEHSLFIASWQDVKTDATTVGASLSSNLGSSRVAPVSQGTIEVEYLPVLTSTTYGAGRTLMRMRLTARNEDQLVHSVTLTNDGKARDADLKNLSLGTRSGRLTDVAATMTGDKVTLTFDPPLRLDRGEDILLLLKGDVRASRKKTIDFEVEEASDVVAGSAKRSTTSQ